MVCYLLSPLKQAGRFGFVFPREFSSLFRGGSRGQFVLLRLLSCGDLKLLRDVTGKALLCSRCSVVLRHWHGPRLHKWLVSKVRVQRTGARWRAQLRGVSEMFKPCQRVKRRERARRSRVVLNRPTFDIAHRRLVQSERRYGAEPRLHGCFFCKASLCDDK